MLIHFLIKINKTLSNKTVHNTLFLYLIQGLNTLLYLFVIPHIVKSIGLELFGTLSVAIATTSYFVIFTDYGFNFSGTRQVSVNRFDNKKLVELFSTIQTIKFVLMLISFIVLLILLQLIDFLGQNRELYILSFGLVVGKFLFPVWFFYGLEKMKIVALLTAIFRIGYAFSIVFLIRNEKDLLLIPLLNSLSVIVPGIIAFLILRFKWNIGYVWPKKAAVKRQLFEGWDLFSSSFLINFYTGSSVLVLSLFASAETIGIFAGIEKILKAIRSMVNPISQALFPNMAFILEKSSQNKSVLFRQVLFPILGLALIGIAIGLTFAEQLIEVSIGHDFISMAGVLRIAIFIPLFALLSNISGVQFLVNIGESNYYSKSVLMSSLLGILLMVGMAYWREAFGLIGAMLITEILMTVLMTRKLLKYFNR